MKPHIREWGNCQWDINRITRMDINPYNTPEHTIIGKPLDEIDYTIYIVATNDFNENKYTISATQNEKVIFKHEITKKFSKDYFKGVVGGIESIYKFYGNDVVVVNVDSGIKNNLPKND